MPDYQIHATADGSLTIWDALHGEHYHSGFGAYGESMHVFIQHGLQYVQAYFPDRITILECGFGTGLNAMLTCLNKNESFVRYIGIEKYPLTEELWKGLRYDCFAEENNRSVYDNIMQCEWEIEHRINDTFTLLKVKAEMENYLPPKAQVHLIYFDAFSSSVQPELWSATVFSRLFEALVSGGVLVTYSAKGTVKQTLRSVGFTLERLPGFGGKRHMLRARKP